METAVYVEQQLFSATWNARTSRIAFLKAVVLTFEAFDKAGRQSSSTAWTTFHAYLQAHAMPAIQKAWAELTDLDEHLFPWSLDEVATTWEQWRKTNTPQRVQYREQLGLEADLFAGAKTENT
jgi:hypothetical protein